MQNSYKKDCYDSNPFIKVHYSYGIRNHGANLQFLHYDKDLILEYYQKGQATLKIEGTLYNISEGDIVILNPDELHVSEPKDNCYIEKIVLHISDGLISQFGVDRTVFLSKIAKKAKGKGNLIPGSTAKESGLSDKICKCMELAKKSTVESNVLLSCKAVEILSELCSFVDKVEDIGSEFVHSNKEVNKIIDYINHHYTEEVNLDTISQQFHFSKYYISHLFKEVVGISPYDYLIVRRLYACNNFIRAGQTIKEACFQAGFCNYSNFFRLYKKHFKITPNQFKEQIKGELI